MVVPINITSSALVVPWLSVLVSGSLALDTWLYIILGPCSLALGPCDLHGPWSHGPCGPRSLMHIYASEGSLRSMWSLHACVHGLGKGSGWDLRVCPTKSVNLEG